MNSLFNVRRSILKKVIATFFLCGFSVFVAAALFSFYPQDSSWFFYSTTHETIKNILGSCGANCAALLFFLFGSSALLLVPFLFFLTYVIATDELKEEWDRIVTSVFALLLCSSIGFYFHAAIIPHGFAPGGFFGSVIVNFLSKIGDQTIVFVFLHLMLLVCMVIISRLSVLTIVEY